MEIWQKVALMDTGGLLLPERLLCLLRRLHHNSDVIWDGASGFQDGYSVRCIQDSEE